MTPQEFFAKNGSGRITEVSKYFGKWEICVGFVDDEQTSGMQVVERKVYKTFAGAHKFSNKWLNG